MVIPELPKFFAEVHRQNLTRHVWILSDVDLTPTLTVNDMPESSIGFLFHNFSDFAFKEYLKDNFVREKDNRGFPEWSDGTSEIWKRLETEKCGNRQIDECTRVLIEEIYSSFVPYIIDTVYALAHAIDINLSTRNFNTSDSSNKSSKVNSFDGKEFLGRVNFEGLTGKIEFDQFGDKGSAHCDIFNFKVVSERNVQSVKQVLVGEWKKSDENETQLTFHEDLYWKTGRPPESECSEKCPPRTRQSATSPCCWQCLPCLGGTISPSSGSNICTECPIGKMSNQAKTECVALPSAHISYASASGILILTFATLGVVVSMVYLVALWKFWNSPIVKASNRELSLALLLAIVSLLSVAFINVFRSTDAICKIIYPLRYLTYNLCLSILLVKVLLISSAFQVPIVAAVGIRSLSN